MPAPPPPPPPPPPASLAGPAKPLPKASNERSKLLSEIHQGARLKKTVTNDRSAPVVGNSNSSASKGFPVNKPSSAIGHASSSPAMQPQSGPIGGMGDLFAGGIVPKKPSDLKNRKFVAANVRPPVGEKSAPVVPPAKPVNSLAIRQDATTTHFPASVSNASASSASSASAPAPPPPPPPMPPAKQKPAPPEAPPASNKPTQKFQTLRAPLPTTTKPPPLRRTGSSENNMKPSGRPAAPPPPPPPGRPVVHAPPVPPPNAAEPPPPPPPPRFTSGNIASSHDSFDKRFTFLHIEELPKPEVFKNISKIYDHHHRSAAM